MPIYFLEQLHRRMQLLRGLKAGMKGGFKMNQHKFVVCLDAGHYGKYNPAPQVPQYFEAEMAWKLHLLLKQELERRGITVVTTRADQKRDLGLVDRGKCSKGADLFVSLHSNAASTPEPDWVVGICSVPDGSSTVDDRSREITTALAKAVAQVMGVGYQVTSRESSSDRDGDGRKDDYYGVLRGAYTVGTPGVILEHGFHTHAVTARWLLVQENLEALARAEAEVIARWLGANKPELNLPMLSRGSSGGTVQALQALLVGYGDKVDVDGIFGPDTEKAVRRYQEKHSLDADGIVGPKTWAMLLFNA